MGTSPFRTLVQNLDRASHVYVFRLMSLEVADGEPWYSTLSGRITVIRTLKGGTPKASGVTYSIGCCNPKLSVGDYYLAALSNDAAILEMVPGDPSAIIVSDDFNTKDGAGKKTGAIEPVQEHLAGQPLPADFPGGYRLCACALLRPSRSAAQRHPHGRCCRAPCLGIRHAGSAGASCTDRHCSCSYGPGLRACDTFEALPRRARHRLCTTHRELMPQHAAQWIRLPAASARHKCAIAFLRARRDAPARLTDTAQRTLRSFRGGSS